MNTAKTISFHAAADNGKLVSDAIDAHRKPCYNGKKYKGCTLMATKRTLRSRRYDDNNTRSYHIKLNYKTDADIIEKLQSVPSMQGYIKELIRNDIGSDEIDDDE